MDTLAKVLREDNYILTIDTIYNDTISYTSYDVNNNPVDSLIIHPQQLIRIVAKGKNKIRDAFYPRLTIEQITFDEKDDIKQIAKRIDFIIFNPNDLINEKVYDKVSVFKNSLYYISTDAKVFEEVMLRYDKELQKIISE
jgi:hypothetical protein